MSDTTFGYAVQRDGDNRVLDDALVARGVARARSVLKNLSPKQRAVTRDPSPLISACCPRRAGKTFLAASMALAACEAQPGAIVVVICMTLKQGRKTWWYGATSGITTLARQHGIPLKTNENELRWEHENGSIGYIMSAESRDTIESLRGLEADLYIIDECKSVAPGLLMDLLDDIIAPQSISRDGRILMIGTPGNLLEGPFWEATCPGATRLTLALDEQGDVIEGAEPVKELCAVPFGEADPHDREPGEYWSYHFWSLEDNNMTEKAAAQWNKALRIKRKNRWADDNPTWQREYMGKWVPFVGGLVFDWLSEHAKGTAVTWTPLKATPENPAGLPLELGPWHMVWGLDLGSNDPTALVVVAYSETHNEMRHVHDEKHQHLLVDDVAALLTATAKRFGPPEAIYADTANLGKMVVATLSQVHGFQIEPAQKRDKNDHIELLNNEFRGGRCKIIRGTSLEHQLKMVAWDLSTASKELLARTGRLREDDLIPNDLTDALMYAFRGCYHAFARSPEAARGLSIEEAFVAWEVKNLERARVRLNSKPQFGEQRGPSASPWGTTPPGLESAPWKN